MNKDTVSDNDTILLTEKEDKPFAKGEVLSYKESSRGKTFIPLSRTPQEYQKAGVTYTRVQQDAERESFERQTNGNWTRKVLSIIIFKDVNDEEFLDWSERRFGKTKMSRSIDLRVDKVASYYKPTPIQQVVYNQQNDENELINTGQEKDRTLVPGIEYSREALDELLQDANPDGCEYIISKEGYRPYNITKKDMQKMSDFTKLYKKKANIPEDEI